MVLVQEQEQEQEKEQEQEQELEQEQEQEQEQELEQEQEHLGDLPLHVGVTPAAPPEPGVELVGPLLDRSGRKIDRQTLDNLCRPNVRYIFLFCFFVSNKPVEFWTLPPPQKKC